MRRSRRFSQANEEIKTVLITGANGFIASHLIEQLLTTTTYNVRASVRNIQDTSKVAHLVTFPNARRRLRLFEADILNEGAFDNAMKDVQVVFHAAAPYFLTSDNPYRDLVEPSETGTFNVLTSATKSEHVHTVVLTSSMRTIADRPREKEYTEDDWNNDSNLKSNPYFYSKVKAEKSAWDFYERSTRLMGVAPFRLVSINPAMVIGPSHTKRMNQSSKVLFEIIKGEIPAQVNLSFWLVDVRDVVKAHILAAQNPHASGRYICASKTLDMAEIISILKQRFPDYKYPWSLTLPNVAAKIVSTMRDPAGYVSYVKTNVGKGAYKFNNSKIRNELGLEFRAIEESLWDQAADFIRWGHMRDKLSNDWVYKAPAAIKDADVARAYGWGFNSFVDDNSDRDIG
ncbi:9918_t:CDS:2 [Paraglomus brasilianum]|uniref:9918_t:CDS:1 n=1 Tax=Paraglomus brasilianum TaxID=144538 RepID=A0A9N8Z2C3_9GLOM|nr:9918_t:CDS:2 [Paraglomus brasilianum]